jgi:hypothetical protein
MFTCGVERLSVLGWLNAFRMCRLGRSLIITTGRVLWFLPKTVRPEPLNLTSRLLTLTHKTKNMTFNIHLLRPMMISSHLNV